MAKTWTVAGVMATCLQSAALAGNAAVSIDCSNDLPAAFCEGLKEAVLTRIGTGTAMHVSFVPSAQHDSLLAGHLEWHLPGAQPVMGPSLEIAVMDRALGAQMLRDYAAQLVQMTDFDTQN